MTHAAASLPVRSDVSQERWFALIKLGELHERFLGDQVQARAWYTEAIGVDAERADAWFVAVLCAYDWWTRTGQVLFVTKPPAARYAE